MQISEEAQLKFRVAKEFLHYLIREYGAKGCAQQAAALTYMTLFAIVPLLTVIFTMFSLFPAFEGLFESVQNFLFKHMLPDSGLEIQQYLSDFTQQARSLTLAGVLILVITAFLMIRNIEATLNKIWGVRVARRGISSFLIYWAILSLGPLLLGMGLAMSTYVLSLRLFADGLESAGILRVLFSVFPWLLTAVAFTLLYVAVPNCKVPFRHAVAGGVLTAVCFELCKDLFGWIVAHSTFRAVYGAFAIVPLFLVWMYVLWMIVLIGALLVKSLSSFHEEENRVECHADLTAALIVIWFFYDAQRRGESLDLQVLPEHSIEVDQWLRLREKLLEARIIIMTADGEYVLSRDLHAVSLRQFVILVTEDGPVPDFVSLTKLYPWFGAISERLASVADYRDETLDTPLAEFFESASAVNTASPEQRRYVQSV